MVGRFSAFQPSTQVDTLGLGVIFISVLSCIVSGEGLGILLITHLGMPTLVILSTVLIHSLASLTGAAGA